jgi:hypothetical protein
MELRPSSRQAQKPHRISDSYVHFAVLLDVQNILSADTGISRKTEGPSFGDHLISESVSVTPSNVIEASIVFCVVMTRVSQCTTSLRPERPV